MEITKRLLLFLRQEELEHIEKREQNEVYVTELVECPLKREFRKELWFLEVTNPSLILGRLVHEGLEKLLQQMFLDKQVQIEVEVEKEFEDMKIKGRIDAIVDNEIVEIKYMRGIRGELPLEHHELQLKLYKWLTGIRKARIIYITPDGIKEYKNDKPINSAEIMQILENNNIPRYEWECKYCAFAKFCPYAKVK